VNIFFSREGRKKGARKRGGRGAPLEALFYILLKKGRAGLARGTGGEPEVPLGSRFRTLHISERGGGKEEGSIKRSCQRIDSKKAPIRDSTTRGGRQLYIPDQRRRKNWGRGNEEMKRDNLSSPDVEASATSFVRGKEKKGSL